MPSYAACIPHSTSQDLTLPGFDYIDAWLSLDEWYSHIRGFGTWQRLQCWNAVTWRPSSWLGFFVSRPRQRHAMLNFQTPSLPSATAPSSYQTATMLRILTHATGLLGLVAAQSDSMINSMSAISTSSPYPIMPAMANATATNSSTPAPTGPPATLTYLRAGSASANLGYVASVVFACKGHTTVALQCVNDSVDSDKNNTLCPGTNGPVSDPLLSSNLSPTNDVIHRPPQ